MNLSEKKFCLNCGCINPKIEKCNSEGMNKHIFAYTEKNVLLALKERKKYLINELEAINKIEKLPNCEEQFKKLYKDFTLLQYHLHIDARLLELDRILKLFGGSL